MKAMIFAAGFGKRLGKLSQETPKPLMDVCGKSMLEHVVDRLKACGVDELVINLHHLPEKIRSHVAERKNFGIKVNFLFEPEILGTGGGLKNAEALLGSERAFFVHNADVYSDLDLSAMMRAHLAAEAMASLAVMDRKTSRYLVFSKDGQLKGWENPDENLSNLPADVESAVRLAFSGIQVVSPKIFDVMRAEVGQFSIIRPYVNAARSGERVQAFRIDSNFWVDVGTPETLEALRSKLRAM